ncbi:MAG: adenylate/guanylate cyclase domain-containing protein [Bacillota bacterium]|nr:adenylate/guanylate cyclase domain-containing protein [Bacillota bacterium]
MPVFTIIWVKNDPSVLNSNSLSKSVKTNEKADFNVAITLPNKTESDLKTNEKTASKKTGDNYLGKIIDLTANILLTAIAIIFILNLPFKIYFIRKRHNKIISPDLYKFCRKFLLKIPLINSAIFLSAFLILHIFMLIVLRQKNSFEDQISRDLYSYYLYISLFSSTLIVVFVYLWQKHRTHFRYLEHVYNPDELRVKIFKSKIGGIRNRLWISSALTTLLPLMVVIFYLVISISSLKDLGVMTPEKSKVVFGHYYQSFVGQSSGFYKNLFYINAIDNFLLIVGVATGIIVSLIYLAIFHRWTTHDIVAPVKELVVNMKRIGEGHMDAQAIVRTNDEIGELTEGYNQMSSELNNYISRISRMNEAYFRFVPREFLEELGKKDITQIELGDQVQREMTILFTDIRGFTELSEDLSPKDTFDFINQYLGIMEPIIANNNGFIDKYIGDSIMALFSKDADDALIATLEMRRVLSDFNELRESEGKNQIDFGTGIHTGNLMLGVVGGYGRMDGTVVSDAVNLASRLEGITKYYGASAIISEDTLIKLKNPTMFNYRLLDIAKVKGKKKAVYIYELIDAENEPNRSKKIETKPYFVQAVEYYKQQAFEEALTLFREVEKIHSTDKATLLYIKRCLDNIKNGIPEDWNYIEIFKFK